MATTGLVSAAMAAPTNTSGKPIDYTSQLQTLYKNNLGRDADSAGASYYNDKLQSGATTIDQVKSDILNSSEYKTLQDKKNLLDGAKAYYATSQGYTPTNWEVGTNQTVAGQLASLTDPNSQMSQRAMAQAQQESAKRGLVNSSLAATAGQAAVIDKALPVAQQDAATYANSGQFNAAAANTAGQFGAQAANTASLQNAQNETAVSQSNAANATNATIADRNNQSQQLIADRGNQTQLSVADKNAASQQAIAGLNADTQKFVAKLNNDAQMAVAQLDAKTKTDLQNIVSNNSQLLQSNTSAANLVSQYITAVGNIQISKDLDANAKAQAIANQAAALREGLRSIGEISGLGIDLSKFFSPEVINVGNTPTQPDPLEEFR